MLKNDSNSIVETFQDNLETPTRSKQYPGFLKTKNGVVVYRTAVFPAGFVSVTRTLFSYSIDRKNITASIEGLQYCNLELKRRNESSMDFASSNSFVVSETVVLALFAGDVVSVLDFPVGTICVYDPSTLKPVQCLGPSYGECTAISYIDHPRNGVMSPMGEHAYIVSSPTTGVDFNTLGSDIGYVALLVRDKTGQFSQPASGACWSATLTKNCELVPSLAAAATIVITPDGGTVVVGSIRGRFTVFSRDNATGSLFVLPGSNACYSADGVSDVDHLEIF